MQLEVRIAQSPEDLDRIFRLRYHVYCETEGYKNPKDYPDKKESDRWDPYSVNFIAVDRDNDSASQMPLGTIRLTDDSDIGFPMEDEFDISSYRGRIAAQGGRRVVEVGRRIVLPKMKDGTRVVSFVNLRLLRAICQYAQSDGITDFICTTHTDHQDFYEKLGFVDIAPPKVYQAVGVEAFPKALVMDDLAHPEIEGNLSRPWNRRLYQKDKALVFLNGPEKPEKPSAEPAPDKAPS